ncbi:MAG: exodeoxyribonuclease VII small subunit [Bacteroidales bacterium]|nr:exodeoxyribonuclease VII small subunit [Candidatus Equimonas enterica]
MTETLSYAQAVARLEQIVSALESGKTDIDQISPLLQEAQQLLAQCKDKLTAVEQDVNRILTHE